LGFWDFLFKLKMKIIKLPVYFSINFNNLPNKNPLKNQAISGNFRKFPAFPQFVQ